MDLLHYEPDVSNMKTILVYSDFFDKETMPDLVDEISKANMHKSISIICELIVLNDSSLPPIQFHRYNISVPFQGVLKNMIIKPSSSIEMFSNPLFSKDKCIISLQTLLLLLKDFILYGNYDTLSQTGYSINEEDYINIVKLQLIEAERLSAKQSSDIDLNHFIYANYHLNFRKNLASELARMSYMMELDKSSDFLSEKQKDEYVNYYHDFEEKYGFTPIEYLTLLFWEVHIYYEDSSKTALRYSGMWDTVENKYRSSPHKDLIAKVIDTVSLKVSDYQSWAESSREREWDFSMFYAFPFIKDNNGSYLSISDVTTINAFFEKLFWLIRECYPEKNKSAMAFFGRLYEHYIQKLTEASVTDEYTYIEEFKYGKDHKLSSDAYLKKGKNLLVVEAKGFSVLQNCMIKNMNIEDNNNKLFINPVLQADRCLNETITIKDELKDIDTAFIISVTMDSINAVPKYYEDIFNRIESQKICDKTKYYFNFSIEEYEILMYLLENGIDIFSVLESYYHKKTLSPFITYVEDRFAKLDLPSFTNEQYRVFSESMKQFLFSE